MPTVLDLLPQGQSTLIVANCPGFSRVGAAWKVGVIWAGPPSGHDLDRTTWKKGLSMFGLVAAKLQ